MSYHFHWSVLWTGQSGTWLLQGLVTTLELSLLAWLLAFMLGTVSGALRTAPIPPLRWVSTFYVEFFRNVPLLVWMVRPWRLPRGALFRGHAFRDSIDSQDPIRSGLIYRTNGAASLSADHHSHRRASNNSSHNQRVTQPAQEFIRGTHHRSR